MLVSRTSTESRQGWTALAPAKLNLYLEVLGRRTDGFHELDTLMVPVRLFDTLSWEPAEADATNEFQFQLANDESSPSHANAPTDSTNLVVRAVELLAKEAGTAPRGKFTLAKRIPTQAGMGGGSSDAAAALKLANLAWNINYSQTRLARLAAELGSDVPFFFAGGPAVCQGRGERTKAIRGLPKLHFVVVKPTATVSTRGAFASLQAKPYRESEAAGKVRSSESLVGLLREGCLSQAASQMSNSFQSVICGIEPSLLWLWQTLKGLSPWGALMTGSGSAFFCLCRTARHANHVAGMLRSRLHWNDNDWSENRGSTLETAFGGKHDRTHGTVWTTSTCH